MDSALLAKIFEEHSGKVYRYPESDDANAVTDKLAEILGNNTFISRIVEIKEEKFVYVDQDLGEEQTDFVFVADLAPPEYQEPPPLPVEPDGSGESQPDAGGE